MELRQIYKYLPLVPAVLPLCYMVYDRLSDQPCDEARLAQLREVRSIIKKTKAEMLHYLRFNAQLAGELASLGQEGASAVTIKNILGDAAVDSSTYQDYDLTEVEWRHFLKTLDEEEVVCSSNRLADFFDFWGHARIGDQRIVIYDLAWSSPDICSLANTVAHETAHLSKAEGHSWIFFGSEQHDPIYTVGDAARSACWAVVNKHD